MAKDRKIDMVILGLLSHGELTGYEIKKQIDGSIRFFWKGSFGSIYPALSELLRQGQVEKADLAPVGGRGQIRYRITAGGREALQAWLEDSRASNELRYETLVKLFFGGAADRETSLRTIDAFEAQVREDLATLQVYRRNLEAVLRQEDHQYYYLTVLFGIEVYEAYLSWCGKARTLLLHPPE